jgi:hypothetical protein
MCGSPEPGEFAVPSSMSDSSEHGSRKRDLIPARKQREFTPDTRKDDTYWDRRRRNNEAAKRSREKRRMNDMVLETRVMELTTENQWLKAELHAIRDKCGIPKDAPPLVNPNSLSVTSSQQCPPQPSYGSANKEQFNPNMHHLRTSPVLNMHLPPQFMPQGPPMGGRGMPVMHTMPAMHPALLGAMPGRMLIPNQHMYIPGNMIPQYGRMACQSVSPMPRSSSSGSRDSPCRSLGDPRDSNGGAISPSIAAVSSLLKLANSHFNGYPHLPREEDSDLSGSGSSHGSVYHKLDDGEPNHGDSEANNHLPLKLRHKTRIEYEPSPSPPLGKAVLSGTNSSSHDEDDMEGGSGYSGEDSAVDVTECDNRKRKNPTGTLQTENVQLRGELQRLASEVANLKVMMKNPVDCSTAPPAKKQRKSRGRR